MFPFNLLTFSRISPLQIDVYNFVVFGVSFMCETPVGDFFNPEYVINKICHYRTTITRRKQLHSIEKKSKLCKQHTELSFPITGSLYHIKKSD
jgi:hypothetical protein